MLSALSFNGCDAELCDGTVRAARELTQEVLPKLQQEGIKLFLVSMGPPERGLHLSASQVPCLHCLHSMSLATRETIEDCYSPLASQFAHGSSHGIDGGACPKKPLHMQPRCAHWMI